MFRKLVYSKTREDYEQAESDFFDDELTNKYPSFISHINRQYIPRKEKWTLYIRNSLQLPTHSVNTSNFVEASFRILKEFTLNRTKVSNQGFIMWKET